MGVADRDYEYRESFRRKRFTLGQKDNALVAIVTINIVIFLFIIIANLFSLFATQGQGSVAHGFTALDWFSLPASLTELAHRPWASLSFMFAHGGSSELFPMLLSMLSSMLWLWMFGFILQDLSGNKYIFPVYIYGSLAGGALFIISAQAIPALQAALPFYSIAGSGAGTMALAAAVTAINHNYRIFRNIGKGLPVWILVAVYFILNILDIFSGNAPFGFAYAGAAFAGFLFVYFLRKGRDGSTWMINLYEWCINLFDPSKKVKNVPVKEKIFYNTGHREPYTKTAIITQKRVDEILDKINQRGYNLLTDEEKNILKKASEEDTF